MDTKSNECFGPYLSSPISYTEMIHDSNLKLAEPQNIILTPDSPFPKRRNSFLANKDWEPVQYSARSRKISMSGPKTELKPVHAVRYHEPAQPEEFTKRDTRRDKVVPLMERSTDEIHHWGPDNSFLARTPSRRGGLFTTVKTVLEVEKRARRHSLLLDEATPVPIPRRRRSSLETGGTGPANLQPSQPVPIVSGAKRLGLRLDKLPPLAMLTPGATPRRLSLASPALPEIPMNPFIQFTISPGLPEKRFATITSASSVASSKETTLERGCRRVSWGDGYISPLKNSMLSPTSTISTPAGTLMEESEFDWCENQVKEFRAQVSYFAHDDFRKYLMTK
jgi:hypothetical protein